MKVEMRKRGGWVVQWTLSLMNLSLFDPPDEESVVVTQRIPDKRQHGEGLSEWGWGGECSGRALQL